MKVKNLVCLALILLFPKIIFSQIVNKGTLHIKESTEVYFENEYVNKFIHNNNGDLYLNSNFINDGITSSSSGTTFFMNLENNINILNINGAEKSINFYNLQIEVNDALGNGVYGVYVEDGYGLIVANELNLINGDLRLVGEAQLVQGHSGVDTNIATGGHLLRDQQARANNQEENPGNVFAYNYWSSPVSNSPAGFSLNGGLYDGTDAGLNPFYPQQVSFTSGYDGVASVLGGSNNVTTALEISDRWLYVYSRSPTAYSAWIAIDENYSISPGLGFTMKSTGVANQNFVFKGTPNNGEYTFPIGAGESLLLGNPYPSAIDGTALINDNRLADNSFIFDKIQFWVDGGSTSHALADYLGGYAIYSLGGGVPASTPISLIGELGGAYNINLRPRQYISVGQGFFVDAISDGDIKFKNSQRIFKTEDGSESIFLRPTNQNSDDTIDKRIRIGYEDPEGFHRQLLLSFLPDEPVSLGYDPGYDTAISSIREDDLFYIIEGDPSQKYVIQSVGAYNETLEFPLGLIMTEVGTHTIMLDEVENFTDIVYLRDNVLNETYNLSASNYTITLPPGEYYDRFDIVFQPQNGLSVASSLEGNVDVYYSQSHIVIQNKDLVNLNKVMVYSMTGQNVVTLTGEALNNKLIQIPFNSPQGMYLVVLNSELGRKTFKIIN